MASDTRVRVLDAAMAVLRDGEPITLESTARRVGITKPGLMYHFPSKEALMIGVVDHVAHRWGVELQRRLGASGSKPPSPEDRMRAYLDYGLETQFDETDLVMFSDVRLARLLAQRWSEHLAHWMEIPGDVSGPRRGRLLAVRVMADGLWFDAATGISPVSAANRDHLRALAYELLERN